MFAQTKIEQACSNEDPRLRLTTQDYSEQVCSTQDYLGGETRRKAKFRRVDSPNTYK